MARLERGETIGFPPARRRILTHLESVGSGFRAFFEGRAGSLKVNTYDFAPSGTTVFLFRERGSRRVLVAAEASQDFIERRLR